jgi:hypothetical protein
MGLHNRPAKPPTPKLPPPRPPPKQVAPAERAPEDGAPSGGRRPTGRVVGVIKRNWRARGYCGALKPEETAGGGAASLLFVPVERRLPMIRWGRGFGIWGGGGVGGGGWGVWFWGWGVWGWG